ncbi:MAG: aminopeptidase P family protein [Caldisericia bacterium]|jgi:Xaa-Pro aminopeptidase|nr:aminopeptidase P family protein [Caldisericia bacterium]
MKFKIPNEVTHFLVTKIENIRYLTNFSGEEGFLLIDSNSSNLIVDSRFTIQANEEVYKNVKVIEYKPPIEEFLANEFKIEKIGLEDKVIYSFYELISKKFGKENVFVFKDIIENLRIVKREDEIEKIKKAEEIAEKAFLKTLELVKEGVSERDLQIELDYQMKIFGGEKNGFDTIILFGERGALPHGKPSNRKLKNGEAIIFDFGTIFEGYHSDCTRTVFFGKQSDEFMRAFQVVYDAQRLGIENAKSEMKSKDVDKISRDYIKNMGFGEYFGHGLGHGVGLEIHEKPALNPRDETILKENMVVTIEPGIYIENKFGIRIEDIIVIKEKELINLTNLPKIIEI